MAWKLFLSLLLTYKDALILTINIINKNIFNININRIVILLKL